MEIKVYNHLQRFTDIHGDIGLHSFTESFKDLYMNSLDKFRVIQGDLRGLRVLKENFREISARFREISESFREIQEIYRGRQ